MKSDSKDLYCYKIFLFLFLIIKNPEKNKHQALFLTLIINQHIIMISVVSCDAEHWSNDAENTAAHHRNIF